MGIFKGSRGKYVVKNSGKITEEELQEKGGKLPAGKGHWVRKELLMIEVGDHFFVDRGDWNWRGKGNGPSRIVNKLNDTTDKTFETALAADGSGWVITRLE